MSSDDEQFDKNKLATLVIAINEIISTISIFTQVAITLIAGVSRIREETSYEQRLKRKRIEGELPYMRNLSKYLGSPQRPLEYRDRFGALMEDPNRDYCRKLTHMFSWEILELAEMCKDDIEAPRQTSWRPNSSVRQNDSKKRGRKPKYSYLNRLLFVLEWLSNPVMGDKAEFDNSYSKTSLVEDHKHILKAINKNLEDQIKWPNAVERRQHYEEYHGIFDGVVGILDIWEHYIVKFKDPQKEHDTFSGKAVTNTKKTVGNYIIIIIIIIVIINSFNRQNRFI